MALFPYPLAAAGATAGITVTTFTVPSGGSGLLLPSAELLSLVAPGQQRGVFVRLLAWLAAPAAATAEARLVVEGDDGRVTALPALLSVRAGAVPPALQKLRSPLAEITSFLRMMAIVSLRLQVRVTSGTGTLVAPTVALYRDAR